MNGRVVDLNAQTKFVCKVGKLSTCTEDLLDPLLTRSCPPLVRRSLDAQSCYLVERATHAMPNCLRTCA
jgi:hypothetical protein